MPYICERLSFAQLYGYTDQGRRDRARSVRGPALELESSRGNQTYNFNFRAYPSTQGKRHQGYVRFFRPSNPNTPLERLECEVGCACLDFRYRHAWANKQRGSSQVGPMSISKTFNRAPRITNPTNKPGLCVARGERVTTQRGLVPVEEVVIDDMVMTLDGWKSVVDSGFTGTKDVVKITLASGRQLRLTDNHQVLVFTEAGGLDWLEAGRLTGDHCMVALATTDDKKRKDDTLSVEPKTYNESHGPSYAGGRISLNSAMAELVGYMASEGADGQFCNTLDAINDDFESKWNSVFGPGSCVRYSNGVGIGKHGSDTLLSMGFKFGSYNKVIPEWIFRGSRSVMVAFLRGAYAGDGCFCKNQSTYASVSEPLARGISLLMTTLGVNSVIETYKSGINKSDVWLVRTSNAQDTDKLFDLLNPVRGRSTEKQTDGSYGHYHNLILHGGSFCFREARKLMAVSSDTAEMPLKDVVCSTNLLTDGGRGTVAQMLAKAKKLTYRRVKRGGKPSAISTRRDVEEITADMRLMRLIRGRAPKFSGGRRSLDSIESLVDTIEAHLPETTKALRTIMRQDVSFDRVQSVEPCGSSDVFDLTVDGAEHFVANGLVVHNCKHIARVRDYIVNHLYGGQGRTVDKLDRLVTLTSRPVVLAGKRVDQAKTPSTKLPPKKPTNPWMSASTAQTESVVNDMHTADLKAWSKLFEDDSAPSGIVSSDAGKLDQVLELVRNIKTGVEKLTSTDGASPCDDDGDDNDGNDSPIDGGIEIDLSTGEPKSGEEITIKTEKEPEEECPPCNRDDLVPEAPSTDDLTGNDTDEMPADEEGEDDLDIEVEDEADSEDDGEDEESEDEESDDEEDTKPAKRRGPPAAGSDLTK